MENRFKSTISRMFWGSFGSCRPAGDVIEKPQPPQKHPYSRLSGHPLPPKTLPFTALCRPDSPETTARAAAYPFSPRPKICSPSIPPSPPPNNPFYKNPRKNNNKKKTSNISYPRTNLSTSSSQDSYKNPKQKKNNSRNNNILYPRRNFFTSSSQDSAYYDGKNYLFSSDSEDGEETEDPPLDPFYQNPRKNNNNSYRRRNLFTSSSQDSNYYSGKNLLFSEDEEGTPFSSKSAVSSRRREKGVAGKVKGSFVVVKRSSDPYRDFRRSMVEMIVEKQIFAAYDLEQLLQCFLSLNSVHYHRVIVGVFVEIHDVLFSHSNWS